MLKKCNKCGEEKEINEFVKDKKSKSGFGNQCKKCVNARARKWKKDNPDKVEKYKEYSKEYAKRYWRENKKKESKRKKEYSLNNKDKVNAYQRKYRKSNRDKVNAWNKKYRDGNDKEKNRRNEYKKLKLKEDVNFKIATNLRIQLIHHIKKGIRGKMAEMLGCQIEEFKKYLQSQFYNNKDTGEPMSWDNYGLYGWHIDHIKPLASFDLTKSREVRKAFHYTNLQPLWAKDNLSKGSKHG